MCGLRSGLFPLARWFRVPRPFLILLRTVEAGLAARLGTRREMSELRQAEGHAGGGGAGREPGGAWTAVLRASGAPPSGESRGAQGSPGGGSHLRCLQVYKGYVDDPRNTDNAWIETVAVSIHFADQSDLELKRLNSVRGLGLRRGRVGALGPWGLQSWPGPEGGSGDQCPAWRVPGRGQRAEHMAGVGEGWMGPQGPPGSHVAGGGGRFMRLRGNPVPCP